MSEPENFLARWSRRKQKATREAENPRPTSTDNSKQAATQALPKDGEPREKQETKEPEIDLSTLPPIDSIGAGTDIKAFLQKGVPVDLARAALRRAWTSDPAIRDFIEVAENQWDFATGKDIPGFGPLEAGDDVRQMVAEIMEKAGSSTRDLAGAPESRIAKEPEDLPQQSHLEPVRPTPANEKESKPPHDEPQSADVTSVEGAGDIVQRDNTKDSLKDDEVKSVNDPSWKNRHGRALPR